MSDSSPMKQIKKLLSPSKQKPPPPFNPPALVPSLAPTTNWTATASTSGSDESLHPALSSGWNVVDAPTFENKENTGPRFILDQVMGSPKRLAKKPSNVRITKDTNLDKEFEELMNSRSIPNELRCKLRTVDPTVKKHMLKNQNHASLSSSPTKSPLKLFHYKSSAELKKAASKRPSASVPTSPVKAHPSAVFTEERVWDVEMASVGHVMGYFGGVGGAAVDVGMVKKLWQLLRNESLEWIHGFLGAGGFGVILGLLKDVLAIEWRDEKDDAVLHQILLCLKALSTTEAGLRELSASATTLFPLLINNLFSDKQPTEFSTRLLIPTLLLAYLTPTPTEEASTTLLQFLTDPDQAHKPHEFLQESYTPRPYKKWHAEITSITRDTFWIYLHPKNIIPVAPPHEPSFPHTAKVTAAVPSGFKGGVEWYATEYLTTHVALVNGVLAGLGERRWEVRRDMQSCGFEGVLGGKLRKASKEYYPGLHLELQRWVWEAHRDGWRVLDVARGFDVEEQQVEELDCPRGN